MTHRLLTSESPRVVRRGINNDPTRGAVGADTVDPSLSHRRLTSESPRAWDEETTRPEAEARLAPIHEEPSVTHRRLTSESPRVVRRGINNDPTRGAVGADTVGTKLVVPPTPLPKSKGRGTRKQQRPGARRGWRRYKRPKHDAPPPSLKKSKGREARNQQRPDARRGWRRYGRPKHVVPPPFVRKSKGSGRRVTRPGPTRGADTKRPAPITAKYSAAGFLGRS